MAKVTSPEGFRLLAERIICHGSFAYCCPLEKECDQRDGLMEMLGISKEDYIRIKEECDKKFIELVLVKA